MNPRLRLSDVDGVGVSSLLLGLRVYTSSGVVCRMESDQPSNAESVGLGWLGISDGREDRPMNSTVLVRLLPI